MGSVLIGIKKFFQNKNTVTIIAILAALGILYWAYSYRIKKATEPVNVPYAKIEIGPRTLITKDMIAVRKVPGGVVNSNVLMNTSDIENKYVLNTAVIPKDGLFYKDMVVKWEDMPSSQFEDIPDGYTVYTLSVDSESTFGNSIFPGNYIDLYYKVNASENGHSVVWLGKFIESIKVLSVTDGSGNNVFETTGNPGSPAYLMFSVPDKIWKLLTIAEKYSGGQLFPVQRNAEYSTNPKKTAIVNSKIDTYIRSFAVSDEELNIGGAK